MFDGFEPQALGRDQIDQAYPIVQSACPGVGVDDWRRFASAMTGDGPRGIMTVQHQGYIHGLYAHRVDADVQHDRVLVINPLIIMAMVHRARILDAMARTIEAQAAEFGCNAVQTVVRGGEDSDEEHHEDVFDRLRHHGHVVEGFSLCKKLAVPVQ